MWGLLIYFMHDNVIGWFSSPTMMFLLIVIAGTIGYLVATGNLHKLKHAYSTFIFFYNHFMTSAKQSLSENKETQKKDEKK